MSTVKQARVCIVSVIDNLSETGLPSGDRERSESSAIGTVLAGKRGAVISFSEKTEGGEVRTKIEILGSSIRVCRHGAIESDMLFSEGVAHRSVYSVPPYSFDANIFTRKIRGSIDNGDKLEIFYDMEIGGAKKSVKMSLVCDIEK